MRKTSFICGALATVLSATAAANPVYQPPGANLTIGDVTHGLRVQSASSNPAAGAADRARNAPNSTGGTILSVAGGIEYGNVQEIFDLIDSVTRGYQPSPPGTNPGPGQLPNPDNGIDINEILDAIDPELRPLLDSIAAEITTQAGLLALIAAEGYGRAWVSADLPVVLNANWLGGTWTTGIGWSGASKAYGIAEPILFDTDEALDNLQQWIDDASPPENFQLSGNVGIRISPNSGNVRLILENDSSILTKASQMSQFNVGYSRQVSGNEVGGFFLGAEARYYHMRLSRFSSRFGDITDSEALFDAIDNSEFNSSTGFGVDIGALWVGENFQVGAQWVNINEPEFEYPELDLSRYRNPELIEFLLRDQIYTMDSQVKLEASLFTTNRRWSAHVGLDADSATDPLGDEYQWATLSGAWTPGNFWLGNLRFGWRQNLAGTELGYASIGATMFRIVNFDVSSALETVKISGTELPQGLMASLGFSINW